MTKYVSTVFFGNASSMLLTNLFYVLQAFDL